MHGDLGFEKPPIVQIQDLNQQPQKRVFRYEIEDLKKKEALLRFMKFPKEPEGFSNPSGNSGG